MNSRAKSGSAVEQHFLKSEERQQKVQFARELMQRAASERSVDRDAVAPTPGFLESVRAFWRSQSLSLRVGYRDGGDSDCCRTGCPDSPSFLPALQDLMHLSH